MPLFDGNHDLPIKVPLLCPPEAALFSVNKNFFFYPKPQTIYLASIFETYYRVLAMLGVPSSPSYIRFIFPTVNTYRGP